MKMRLTIPFKPLFSIGLVLFLVTANTSCTDTCTNYTSYIYYEPVYLSFEDLREGIKQVEVQREIKDPGALYYINGYLLINQPGKGLHVINNSNPSSPVYHSFIEIPGNFSMAAKGNYLYVDSFVDLVVLNIQNISNVNEVTRIENYFSEVNSFGFYSDPEKGVVMEWKEIENIETMEGACDEYYYGAVPFRNGWAFDQVFTTAEINAAAWSPANKIGIGGSLAKFTIMEDRLFSISQSSIKGLNIASPEQPYGETTFNLGWGIETLFPYGDKLFVGANTGMHIVDMANPLSPERLSTFSHVTACDPVVVQGNYAYVTLRGGNACWNAQNLLEVVDISDLRNPQLKASFPLFNPGGLGVDGNTLFICDGDAGLKVFDKSDIYSITSYLIKVYPEIKAIDVIPYNGVLMVIARDGFYQFTYDNPSQIELISKIDFSL